ncbi:hypothetical protein [Xenorhabdus sp. PB30.3]|uniref:hypothetical protein n=1 Tax=Xenorhabdus sp. PB30.3 TaxID=2788941 RepID=UPI001E2B2338|nr:hypothetical protein [Xenorhabdus sp. PB30.3]MCC8381428.1 hypothetical protein [Xenorhabdus sp. PB30.3]
MIKTSSLPIFAESEQVPLYTLTLRVQNMIPSQSSANTSFFSPIDPAITFLGVVLKYLYDTYYGDPKKKADIIELIREELVQHTIEWLDSEYQAVRADARSLQDAIQSWKKAPTEHARDLVMDRNEIAIAALRRLCILSINTAKKTPDWRLPIVCALSCILYFFILADTLIFGKAWGYAEDVLKKYSEALAEQADIMFKDVLLTNIQLNGDSGAGCEALRSIIYWTSDYTNFQDHLSPSARRKPTRVCLNHDYIMANPISDEYQCVYFGDIILTNTSYIDYDHTYAYLSAASYLGFNMGKPSVTIPVKNAGRYRIRIFYAYEPDKTPIPFINSRLYLEQAGQTIMDTLFGHLKNTILTHGWESTPLGPVLYSEAEIELSAGDLFTYICNDWGDGWGYASPGFLKHVEFLVL